MNNLYILWTDSNPTTATNMVLLYAMNAMKNKWWEKITIISCGATQQLLLTNANIYEMTQEAKHLGVEFSCSLPSATAMKNKERLEKLGFEVKEWGPMLTGIIKSNEKLITI
jgi:hypothetical protein